MYVCDGAGEVKRGGDGLPAVSVIGALDRLISGPEAWVLHSTAHLEEDFNLSMRKRPGSVFMTVSSPLSSLFIFILTPYSHVLSSLSL